MELELLKRELDFLYLNVSQSEACHVLSQEKLDSMEVQKARALNMTYVQDKGGPHQSSKG